MPMCQTGSVSVTSLCQIRPVTTMSLHQIGSVTVMSLYQIGSLEQQLAKLRAQIEKGEAARHNIEFELTKAQREVTQQKQQQTQRESSLHETSDELRRECLKGRRGGRWCK